MRWPAPSSGQNRSTGGDAALEQRGAFLRVVWWRNTLNYMRASPVTIRRATLHLTAMILLLDLDRTLNRLYPPSARSIRDLAPADLRAENGSALWDWIVEHLSKMAYPPLEEAFAAIRLLSTETSAIFVNTGRPEALRETSHRWLSQFANVDHIWMRSHRDFRRTAEVKLDNIVTLVRSHPPDDIFAFDDNEAALEKYRQVGMNTMTAPECWNALLAALNTRALGETPGEVLRRCALRSLDRFVADPVDQ